MKLFGKLKFNTIQSNLNDERIGNNPSNPNSLSLIRSLNLDLIFDPPLNLTKLIQMNSGHQEDVAVSLIGSLI